MLKKIILFLIIPFILCGCSCKEESVTFATWGSVTEVGIIKKIISDFELENPNIKINLMHIPQNYFPKIHLLFASNTAPDIIFINNLNLPVYAKYLEPVEDINTADFYPQGIKGLKYNDVLLAVPRDISNLVFYVNTDKVKLPKKNWKLEDLLKIKSKNGSFVVGYEDLVYFALPYLRYFGGEILDNNGVLIIDDDKSQAGLGFYKNLKNKYNIAPQKSDVGSSTLAQMFIEEKIIFYLSGRWMYPKISEKAAFNWSVINFPNGKLPQPCDVSGWAITRGSKNKIAAKKFVDYISSEKSAEYFAKTGLIVPARIKASELLNNNSHNEKIFLEAIQYSENTHVNKDYKKITDNINKNFDL